MQFIPFPVGQVIWNYGETMRKKRLAPVGRGKVASVVPPVTERSELQESEASEVLDRT